MLRGLIPSIWAAALLMLALLAPARTVAAGMPAPGEIRSSCWAAQKLAEGPSVATPPVHRWHCADRNYSLDGERLFLRFDIGADDARPYYFLSRSAALQAVHLFAIDSDGSVRRASFPAAALLNARSGGYFKAPLPEIKRTTRQIVVAIDQPSHHMTLEHARLTSSDKSERPQRVRILILLAVLCGMVAMPIVFNAAFYRILREPFVLWHSALAFSLVMTIMLSSGLAAELFGLPAMTLSWMATLVFGLTIASGMMFTYSFIEADRLHPLLRRALPWCAAWAIASSLLHAAFPFVARPVQSSIYTAAFTPVIAIFIWSMIDALRRGSRAAKFQAIGYAPMILVGLIRLITGIFPSFQSNDAMPLFYLGCAWEVLFTTMGVADRFMAIRHQRDRARTEAELLERLAETDTLTGLFNRRAIETHFDLYRSEGFDTLAILDLDHFKRINDTCGHGVGDRVLRAAAQALRHDRNMRAFRIGGEEFVLLLRGDDAEARAEQARRGISAIVAHAVPGLAGPVTASMGVTRFSMNDAADDAFTAPYERADKLLYEAKLAGRNRTKTDIGHKRSPDKATPCLFNAESPFHGQGQLARH